MLSTARHIPRHIPTVKLNVIVDDGFTKRSVSVSVKEGSTLKEAMSLLPFELQFKQHSQFGAWITAIDKVYEKDGFGWQFYIYDGINFGLPYTTTLDGPAFLGLDNIRIFKPFNLEWRYEFYTEDINVPESIKTRCAKCAKGITRITKDMIFDEIYLLSPEDIEQKTNANEELIEKDNKRRDVCFFDHPTGPVTFKAEARHNNYEEGSHRIDAINYETALHMNLTLQSTLSDPNGINYNDSRSMQKSRYNCICDIYEKHGVTRGNLFRNARDITKNPISNIIKDIKKNILDNNSFDLMKQKEEVKETKKSINNRLITVMKNLTNRIAELFAPLGSLKLRTSRMFEIFKFKMSKKIDMINSSLNSSLSLYVVMYDRLRRRSRAQLNQLALQAKEFMHILLENVFKRDKKMDENIRIRIRSETPQKRSLYNQLSNLLNLLGHSPLSHLLAVKRIIQKTLRIAHNLCLYFSSYISYFLNAPTFLMNKHYRIYSFRNKYIRTDVIVIVTLVAISIIISYAAMH